MNVEIWSDFACPFCYIGKRHFEQALRECGFLDDVQVTFRSFELSPDADRDPGLTIHELLAQKYGISVEQARVMNDQMTARAQTVGLTYRMDSIKPTNMFDAHRLTHFAAEHGKLYELTERLFRAYFTESLHLADHDTLASLAADVGLSKESALQVLGSNAYGEAVRADEHEAQALGIQGVPFFVINRRYAVSGAQPVSVFVEALRKARSDETPFTVIRSDAGQTDDAICTDESCDIPSSKP